MKPSLRGLEDCCSGSGSGGLCGEVLESSSSSGSSKNRCDGKAFIRCDSSLSLFNRSRSRSGILSLHGEVHLVQSVTEPNKVFDLASYL
ncbi:unnamed protein product [Linum trigynum]|uniref:Uncharacterized protein n=1 Tax=Linum trigynum TaxID=586398 RepID=A0AAV2DFJ8_9ROSI